MPRELRVIDVAEPFPSESEASGVSHAGTAPLRGADRRRPRLPDNAIELTATETEDAIELFASEADADPAWQEEPVFAIDADLELNTVAREALDDAAADVRIDEWSEPRALASRAGELAVPAPHGSARLPVPALTPAAQLLTRLTRIAAAAMLLVAIVALTLAFRIRPVGGANEDTPLPSIPRSAAVTHPLDITAPADLVDSRGTFAIAPLASSVAAVSVTAASTEGAERMSPPATPLARVLEDRVPLPARVPPAIQGRSTGVPATVSSAPAAARMPTLSLEPEKPPVPAAAAPGINPPPAIAAPPPAVASPGDGRGAPPGLPSTDASRAEAAATEAIVQVLNRYRAAFNQLDAEAARSVWPAADVRGLGRAFESLQEQQLSFDDCAIALQGDRAVANCRGTATYVPKVGRRSPRVEARQWRFEVQRHASEWLIQSVTAR